MFSKGFNRVLLVSLVVSSLFKTQPASALALENVLNKLGIDTGARQCDSTPKPVEDMSAQQMFSKGEELLNRAKRQGRHIEACEAGRYFFEIQRQFPNGSKEYRLSQIRYIEALRVAGDYIAAINEANIFMRDNRGSERVEEAHYQIVLAVKAQIYGPVKSQEWAKFALGIGPDQEERNPFLMNLSFHTFMDRFPNSPRSAEVKSYLQDARESMAGQYYEIGLFYLKKREYKSAILRFKAVVQNGKNTSYFAPSAYYLIQSFREFARDVRNGNVSDKRLAAMMGVMNASDLSREAISAKAEDSADILEREMRKNLPNDPWTAKL